MPACAARIVLTGLKGGRRKNRDETKSSGTSVARLFEELSREKTAAEA